MILAISRCSGYPLDDEFGRWTKIGRLDIFFDFNKYFLPGRKFILSPLGDKMLNVAKPHLLVLMG